MSFLKVWTGAAWKTVDVANIFRVYVGGVWKDVSRVLVYRKVGNVGGWHEVWKAAAAPPPTPPDPPAPVPPPYVPSKKLTVTITPTSPTYGTAVGAPAVVEAPQGVDAVAVASGGVPPYTYTWSKISWSGSISPTITSPDTANTRFHQTMVQVNQTKTARFACHVVDSKGDWGEANYDVSFNTVEAAGTGGTGGGVGGGDNIGSDIP